MKTAFTLMAGLLMLWSANTWAAATVALNNYDSMLPILYWESGATPVLAPKARTYVKFGTVAQNVMPIGQSSPIIPLREDGYFDGGYGVLAPAATNSFGSADLILYVWMDAPTFEESTRRSWITIYGQPVGYWDATVNPPLTPTAPPLVIPDKYSSQVGYPAAVIIGIPEPHTWSLMIIGLSALVWKPARS